MAGTWFTRRKPSCCGRAVKTGSGARKTSGRDGGTPATYADGLAVSFADQAGVATSAVQLDSEVSPGSMLVRNTTTRYELAGTGVIANTAVTKEGTEPWCWAPLPSSVREPP